MWPSLRPLHSWKVKHLQGSGLGKMLYNPFKLFRKHCTWDTLGRSAASWPCGRSEALLLSSEPVRCSSSLCKTEHKSFIRVIFLVVSPPSPGNAATLQWLPWQPQKFWWNQPPATHSSQTFAGGCPMVCEPLPFWGKEKEKPVWLGDRGEILVLSRKPSVKSNSANAVAIVWVQTNPFNATLKWARSACWKLLESVTLDYCHICVVLIVFQINTLSLLQ